MEHSFGRYLIGFSTVFASEIKRNWNDRINCFTGFIYVNHKTDEEIFNWLLLMQQVDECDLCLVSDGFASQRASNVESASMSWRHYTK